MPLEDIKEVAKYLNDIGKYAPLLARYSADVENKSIWFEMVFAYWLHERSLIAEYEVNVNPAVGKTVDFSVKHAGLRFNMELVRIENSAQINQLLEAQANQVDGMYSLLLHSDAKDPHFTTAAQLIRVQEKVLEKVEKFGPQEEGVLSLVIVDCSNINAGILDAEDVRMVAYGTSAQPAFQEYWAGHQLKGMFNAEFDRRHAEILRERLSAVVFLQKLKPDGLDHIFVASNRAKDVGGLVKKLPVFDKVAVVAPI